MSETTSSADWLKADRGDTREVASAIEGAIDILEKSPYEIARRQSLLYDLELYLGRKLSDLYQLGGVTMSGVPFRPEQQIAFNVCYSITNTIHNRICSFRPRAQFLPDGGDHKAQRAAKDMTDLSDAWAQHEDYQGESSFAMRDCLTGDGGVMKMIACEYGEENDADRRGEVEIARFPSWEFYFDEAEGIYRIPECGYHVHYLPVELAARKYEIDEAELRTQTIAKPIGLVYTANRNMVRIVDAYSRGPEGRHVLCVGRTIKIDKEWEIDRLPMIVQTFDRRPVGMWGDGAVMQLRPIQDELIEWQNSARESHALSSQQVWQTPMDEDGPTKINNATIRIERYKDRPSTVVNPAALNAEMYQYYNLLEQAGYKKLGVSQFIAAGTKQPGINSAVAIRESSELQTDRLALLSQQWENMRVEAAQLWRLMTADLVKRGYKVGYRAIRRGTFVEMGMENVEREYEIRAFPSSLFGQTISGRLERATELITAQFITKPEALKALDIPDLSPIVNLELSEAYAMEYLVDQILEANEYVTPDEQINPSEFYEYARKRYLLTISDGSNYPEANLASLRKLLQYLKPKAAAAAQVQMGSPLPGAQTPGASPEQIQAEQTPATTPGGGNGMAH